ncbi:MAG: hypothetical protein Q8K70_12460 [Bacteroidota bacterium]|nr:hypothetical protein [Bacteroidota bacterium]
MQNSESNNILKTIISSSKLKVLTNQHILSRSDFSNIQMRLIERFEELDIRIIGDRVILNIPNNLKFLLSVNKCSITNLNKK